MTLDDKPRPIEPPPAAPAPSAANRPFLTRIRAAGARLGRWLFRTRRRSIATILVGLPLVLCLSYWLFGFVAFADAASLVELKGLVQARPEQEDQWQPAHLNQLLWRQHRLRTGNGSSARLLFFNVSTVDLAENTEVGVLQVAKRRGGSAVDVVLKTWVGKTAIRAVRFVDPSSTFKVETPVASTVVRGARFTVQVAEDGTTQVDLEEGSAEIEVNGEIVTLAMGQRITLEPGGLYHTEQIFEPNPQLIYDKLDEAWAAPGDAWELELTETEVNQFLAAMSQQPDFFLRDSQVWFVEGEARAATTVLRPTRFDLSAAAAGRVTDGELRPQLRALAAGVALPLPEAVLTPALDQVLNRLQEYLVQSYDFVEFTDIRIEDGRLIVTGHKRPDAPVGQ